MAGAVVLLAVVEAGSAPAHAANSRAHWQTFEDGSVSHGPDAPITVLGQSVYKSFDPSAHDGLDTRTDVEPDASTRDKNTLGLPTVHAIYVYPKGGENRIAQFAAMFQQDLRDASDLLVQDYGRGIRIDERFSDALKVPVVDITVVESASTAEQLTASSHIFWLVRQELSRKFRNPDKKYIVWIDATREDSCGQANLFQDPRRTRNNMNQYSTFAMIYRPGLATNLSGGFCRSSVVLHELGHALGALQETAPHAYDGAHCDDSENDIMCYPVLARWGLSDKELEENPTGEAASVIGHASHDAANANIPNPNPVNAVFDFNNDDYWDPAAVPGFVPTATDSGRLGWWTANLSRFLCSTEGCDKPANETGYDSPTKKRHR